MPAMRRPSDEAGILLLTLLLAAYSVFLAGECLGLWHLLPWPCAQGPRIQKP